jgi:hypothetical protein
MIRLITTYFFVLFFVCNATSLQAQTSAKSKINFPDNGFWVMESNVKTPKTATIFFYNNNHDLVYKETINGKKLKVTKPKVQRQLNSVLDQALTAWKKEQVAKENRQWVVKGH